MNKLARQYHLLLVVLCLLLASCGDPLDDRYGVTDQGSINGCSILKQAFAQRSDLHVAHLLSPRLEETDDNIIVHVSRTGTLPDAQACEWLNEWLRADYKRQAVIILRNGNLTPWLCHRWAQQARAEAQRSAQDADKLRALADQLEKRASVDTEPLLVDRELSCQFFSWKLQAETTPLGIQGLELTALPQVMRVGGTISLPQVHKVTDKKKRRPLVEAEQPNTTLLPLIELQTDSALTPGGHGKDAFTPWAVAISINEDSRLIVIADALPLLDGAQPDPAARALMQAFISTVLDYSFDDPRVIWLNHLRVRGEGGQPNPLVAVLTTPPIAWITWHVIVLLVVIAFLGAGWLGRREATRDFRHDRFSRHVLALAARLRDTHQASWCARAIARVVLHHREQTPNLPDEAAARQWLEETTQSHASTLPQNEKTRSS